VVRIFTMFLDGYGYLAIAERLTAQHLPPPSGHDRARNPHRLGLAWSKSVVRAILSNPRYTGYQVWNKQRRDEVLLDIDDVAAGHVSKIRWNPRDQWISSAEPTHPRWSAARSSTRSTPASPPAPPPAPAPRRPPPGRTRCGAGYLWAVPAASARPVGPR
jgi:hypothetical protein